jgi:hypothetical protein
MAFRDFSFKFSKGNHTRLWERVDDVFSVTEAFLRFFVVALSFSRFTNCPTFLKHTDTLGGHNYEKPFYENLPVVNASKVVCGCDLQHLNSQTTRN